jgi:hypothetical protein
MGIGAVKLEGQETSSNHVQPIDVDKIISIIIMMTKNSERES